MANSFTILVGTVGQGMNVSGDSGETWTKIRTLSLLDPVRAFEDYATLGLVQRRAELSGPTHLVLPLQPAE